MVPPHPRPRAHGYEEESQEEQEHSDQDRDGGDEVSQSVGEEPIVHEVVGGGKSGKVDGERVVERKGRERRGGGARSGERRSFRCGFDECGVDLLRVLVRSEVAGECWGGSRLGRG